MEISFTNPEKRFVIKQKTFHCDCIFIELDMDLRSIKCLKCGANVDPFNYLVGMAIREERLQKLK